MASIPYTVAAAAQALGLAVPTVYKLIADGALTQAPVEGKAVLVTAASVRKYKRKQKGGGTGGGGG